MKLATMPEARGSFRMLQPREKKHILLIDDDMNMHVICKKILEKAGYVFHSALNGANGLKLLHDIPIDLILLDYMMPGMDGFSLFKQLRTDRHLAAFRNIPVIMLSVLSENNPKKEKLLEMGLSLYLNKPFGSKELINVIENVFYTNTIHVAKREREFARVQQARRLATENRRLRNRLHSMNGSHGIVGLDPKMQALFEKIKKIARTDASVLITGESGTGKELVARAIHEYSNRSSSEFVPVDCVALPATLLESELFGYEKGAFTGAARAKVGLFETANGGTFFLDEIGELPPELQAKLLRVLQERKIRHIGGKALIDIDVRIIAATNRNPAQAVKNGRLREDLYYRLNVIPIHLPPLRERREDVPLLIQHFLEKFCLTHARRQLVISEEAERALTEYNWPGNVRELQNVVERMVSLAAGRKIALADVPEHIRDSNHYNVVIDHSKLTLKEAREKWLEKYERKYLIDLIKSCDGNISLVARRAGVNRMTIYRMLKKYAINLRLQIDDTYN